MDLEYSRRPLPLELLVEMHKCLPLADAINVLVNVPSFAFVDINKPRMLRTIRQLKTSLNEYIGTLVGEEEANNNNREIMEVHNKIEWNPQMDSLLRYGSWLTSKRCLFTNNVVGMRVNFVEKLLLHLANSSSSQMTLRRVRMKFGGADLPIPTFIKQLLFNEKNQFWISCRILFESFELKTENGQILCVHDGELRLYGNGFTLILFLKNKIDRNIWFKITLDLVPSKEFIQQLEFSQWKMQSFNEVANFIIGGVWPYNDEIKQNGNKLEVKSYIYWNHNLDMFLRRGAGFTQFQHFKINQQYSLRQHLSDFVDFLINHISNTKHPDDFLESIDINLYNDMENQYFPSGYKIWKYFLKGIREGFDNKKLHILSAKILESNNKLEFTLANLPSNGEYLFDVSVKFGYGLKKINGIKIEKRKNDQIVELNCEDQIEKKQLGRKAAVSDNDWKEDEDEPTSTNKIMKK